MELTSFKKYHTGIYFFMIKQPASHGLFYFKFTEEEYETSLADII